MYVGTGYMQELKLLLILTILISSISNLYPPIVAKCMTVV